MASGRLESHCQMEKGTLLQAWAGRARGPVSQRIKTPYDCGSPATWEGGKARSRRAPGEHKIELNEFLHLLPWKK